MRTRFVVFTIVTAAVVGAAWWVYQRRLGPDGFDRKQNVLAPETRKVLDMGERFVLLSLDPEYRDPLRESAPMTNELFHNYAVLGRTNMREKKDRAELLRALYKGIAKSDGTVADCFNPRHGIRATLGDATVDLVICFECYALQAHAKDRKALATTRSPESTFNRALERARLPMSKREGK